MGAPEAEDEVEAAGELAIATTSGDPSARPTELDRALACVQKRPELLLARSMPTVEEFADS